MNREDLENVVMLLAGLVVGCLVASIPWIAGV